MKYTINLVRWIQLERRAEESRRLKTMGLLAFGGGLVLISLFYSFLQIRDMRASIRNEKTRITQIKAEYQQYKASQMIVNRSDIELLDQLQNDRIFWTRILVPVARFLPDNYWITRFGYEKMAMTINGYGYITPRQEQLITIDDYLNELRRDAKFNEAFGNVYMNSTERRDDGRRLKVSFSYSAAGGRP